MKREEIRVLITGANGFIGKNLTVRLKELEKVKVEAFVRGDDPAKLIDLVSRADTIIHLAGENRPIAELEFTKVNTELTLTLCDAIRQELVDKRRRVPLLFASSIQAELDNPYGRSKLAAEKALKELANTTSNPCLVFRLPGVFGKWCKPKYNSVVATFCYNVSRGIPLQISDPSHLLRLVYIDDVVNTLIQKALNAIKDEFRTFSMESVLPQYDISLGELAEQIKKFELCSTSSLQIERVGTGLIRALYSTYVSYLPTERFQYELVKHEDLRGVFVEMLKTPDCGQFSYFSAHPGVTRGGHYHHSKTEKFLVLKGKALFRFRHLLSNELVELHASGDKPTIVDTIPGWSHDITNVGDEEMLVMLWANENFDRNLPDTIAKEI